MNKQVTLICLAAVTVTLILTVTLTNSVDAQRRSKCSPARDQQMDLCASRMGFLGDHSFRVPKNVSAMGPFCDDLKSNIACLQSYMRDCMQGFTKQILTGILKRGKQQHSTLCRDDATKRDFLNKMGCLTDDKIGQFHLCMDASISRFEYIRSSVKQENRLPGLCCSYQLFNEDIDETVGRLCPANIAGNTNNKIDEFIHKIAGGTAGEFYHLICDGLRSLEECRANDKTRDSLKKFQQITRQVKEGKTRPKAKSLIPVLLDILDNSDPIS